MQLEVLWVYRQNFLVCLAYRVHRSIVGMATCIKSAELGDEINEAKDTGTRGKDHMVPFSLGEQSEAHWTLHFKAVRGIEDHGGETFGVLIVLDAESHLV